MDGNHKLIRWRLVIHGCIDGYSRAIVGLQCSTNNEADTVLDMFLRAIQEFRCPLRIRTDHGTENVAVARWMLQKFGVEHHPVITGLSVHNQRIERLWVDVSNYVISHFKNIFAYLESEGLLDPLDEIDMYALHYIFVPRINQALYEMQQQWNNHALSTMSQQTPIQIWTEGFYCHISFDCNTVNDLLDFTNVNWDDYGIDDYSPTPELETNNHVVVPRSSINLHEVEKDIISRDIDPHTDDNKHGINLYIQCRQTLQNILE